MPQGRCQEDLELMALRRHLPKEQGQGREGKEQGLAQWAKIASLVAGGAKRAWRRSVAICQERFEGGR